MNLVSDACLEVFLLKIKEAARSKIVAHDENTAVQVDGLRSFLEELNVTWSQ